MDINRVEQRYPYIYLYNEYENANRLVPFLDSSMEENPTSWNTVYNISRREQTANASSSNIFSVIIYKNNNKDIIGIGIINKKDIHLGYRI